MVARGPAAQREQVRAWLVALLAAEGVTIALEEPTDWSRWDPRRGGARRERPDLPVLRRRRRSSASGSGAGRSSPRQWRCQACDSYFEAVREDFDDPVPADPREEP